MKPLLAAITLVILFSCKKENSSTQTITVNLQECSGNEIENTGYTLCFDSLWDSRCPANVECVWAGVAEGKFRFTVNNQVHIIRLSTLDMQPEFNTDTTVAGFHLKLVNVSPYPVYPIDPSITKTATIEVTQ